MFGCGTHLFGNRFFSRFPGLDYGWHFFLGDWLCFLRPAMRIAHCNHSRENVAPSFGGEHGLIWKHAPVPTNVAQGARRFPNGVAQPIPGMMRDIESAPRIIWQAMMAGFVVSA